MSLLISRLIRIRTTPYGLGRSEIASSIKGFLSNDHGSSGSAGEHSGGMDKWKKMTFFIALPAVVVCWINCYLIEKEEYEHFERPEFVPYQHLYIRNKKYPWGDGNHTFFHNKRVNAQPDGYED